MTEDDGVELRRIVVQIDLRRARGESVCMNRRWTHRKNRNNLPHHFEPVHGRHGAESDEKTPVLRFEENEDSIVSKIRRSL